MNDQYSVPDPLNELSALDPEKAALVRRRLLATEMLRQNDTLQSIGGHAVPWHPGTSIGNIANNLAGQLNHDRLDTEVADLGKRETDLRRQIYQNAGVSPEMARGMSGPEDIRENLQKLYAIGESGRQRGEDRAARLQQASDTDARMLQIAGMNNDARLQIAGMPSRSNIGQPNQPRPQKAPSGYQWDDAGSALQPIPGGPAEAKLNTAKPLTQDQANAGLFSDRMSQADATLNEIGTGYNPLRMQILDAIPGGNYLQGAPEQKVSQAQRDFINATLRRESGAAISESEFDNARKQYFHTPGDKPETLQQKASNRQTAITGIRRAAGPGVSDTKTQASSLTDNPQSKSNGVLEVPSSREGQRGVTKDGIRFVIRNGRPVKE